MTDNLEGFRRLENDAEDAFGMFVTANNMEYSLLAGTLGFQKTLTVTLKKTGNLPQGGKPESWLYGLCYHNTERIHSAVKALGSQYFPACFALIRVTFESFPKLFYCMRNPVETIHILCCEEYYYQQITKKPNREMNTFCKPFKKQITDEIRDNFKKIEWYRMKIYDGSLDTIKETYGKYSINSHPNLEPIHPKNVEEVEIGWRVGLEILNSFALLNLFILINVIPDQLKAIQKYDEAKRFVMVRMRQNKQSINNFMRLMYPDRREYRERLPFALPPG